MARYRQMVDAFLWTGNDDQVEKPVWITNAIREGDAIIVDSDEGLMLEMETCMPGFGYEVTVFARPGDYVVHDELGNLFPYQRDVFKKLFEPTDRDDFSMLHVYEAMLEALKVRYSALLTFQRNREYAGDHIVRWVSEEAAIVLIEIELMKKHRKLIQGLIGHTEVNDGSVS